MLCKRHCDKMKSQVTNCRRIFANRMLTKDCVQTKELSDPPKTWAESLKNIPKGSTRMAAASMKISSIIRDQVKAAVRRHCIPAGWLKYDGSERCYTVCWQGAGPEGLSVTAVGRQGGATTLETSFLSS